MAPQASLCERWSSRPGSRAPRARARPRRAATPRRALTYARAARAARAPPASSPRAARRRGPRRRSRCRPGVDFAVAPARRLLLGALAVPVDLRLRPAERAGRRRAVAVERRRSTRRGDGAARRAPPVTTSTRPRRRAHLRHDRRAQAGRADLRQLAVERARLGASRSALDPRRALAVRAAAVARRRAVDPRAPRDLRARPPSCTSASTPTASCTRCARERRHARLARRRRRSRGCSTPGCAHPPALRCALLGGGAACPPRCSPRARDAGVPRRARPTASPRPARRSPTLAARRRAPAAGRRCSARASRSRGDGEILVAGPTVAPGAGAGGWLRTGDLGASTSAAACASPAARPTRSSPAARTSRPPRSRRCSRAHPAVRRGGGRSAAPDPRVGRGGRRRIVVAARRAARPTPRTLRAHCAGARWRRFKVPKARRASPTRRCRARASGKLLRARAVASRLMDAEAYRDASRERWERPPRAGRAPRAAAASRRAGLALADRRGRARSPARRVLELAAGLGDTGLLAAELRRARAASSIISDGAEAMLDGRARARAASSASTTSSSRPIDAEWIDLPPRASTACCAAGATC